MGHIPYSCPSLDEAIDQMNGAIESLETTRSINGQLRERIEELEGDETTWRTQEDEYIRQIEALKEEIKQLQETLAAYEMAA